MNIDEFNCNISKLQSRAKILSNYLVEMFFTENDEFDSIVIEYEYQDRQAIFYVCFNLISNDIIVSIKNIYNFIGLNYDEWIIKIKNFNIKDEPMAFIEFKSNEELINYTINKIETINNKDN